MVKRLKRKEAVSGTEVVTTTSHYIFECTIPVSKATRNEQQSCYGGE